MKIKVLHVGAKVSPAAYGGVEKIVFDLFCQCKGVVSFSLVDRVLVKEDRVIERVGGLWATVQQVVELCRIYGIDIVHLHKETSIPCAILLRIRGIRCVLTIHGFGWRVARWSYLQRFALWALDLIAYMTLRSVVFCSVYDYNYARRFVKSDRLVCVPNGVGVSDTATNRFNSRGLVYLGRISPEKNIPALVAAVRKAGLPLCVYGPIDERNPRFFKEIRMLIARKEMQYGGVVKYEDVPAVLSRYATLVNPSFSEGLPVSVLEAAAAGLNLLLSDIPAHRMLRFPDATYFNPKEIDFASIESKDLTRSLNNQNWVINNFSLEAMVRGYELVYKEVNCA